MPGTGDIAMNGTQQRPTLDLNAYRVLIHTTWEKAGRKFSPCLGGY